jgi:hypothetical protein
MDFRPRLQQAPAPGAVVKSATLRDLDDELARLQAKQSNLADPAQEQRKREAAHHRRQMEENNQRKVDAIEPVRRQAAQLQQSVEAMRKSKTADISPQFEQRLRGFEHELAKTLGQLAAMVARAKIEIAASQTKIAWCRHVEAGRSPDSEADVAAGMDELAKEGGQ